MTAPERLTYDRATTAVTDRSDTSDGPTAGTETVDPLECLARMLVPIPDQGHVTTRSYGGSANRPRGTRRKAAPTVADGPPAIVPAPRLAPTEAARRRAALLPQIVEVDPLACPTGRGPMRSIARITQASVIDPILAHLRSHAESALDPRTVGTGRHATARCGPPRPLSLTPTPRSRAGTFGVRVRPTGASDRSPRRPGADGQRRPDGQETRRRAAGRPLRAGRPSRGRRSRRMFDSY